MAKWNILGVPVTLDFTPPPTEQEIENDLQTLHDYDEQLNSYRKNDQGYRGYRETQRAAQAAYDGLIESGVMVEYDGSLGEMEEDEQEAPGLLGRLFGGW